MNQASPISHRELVRQRPLPSAPEAAAMGDAKSIKRRSSVTAPASSRLPSFDPHPVSCARYRLKPVKVHRGVWLDNTSEPGQAGRVSIRGQAIELSVVKTRSFEDREVTTYESFHLHGRHKLLANEMNEAFNLKLRRINDLPLLLGVAVSLEDFLDWIHLSGKVSLKSMDPVERREERRYDEAAESQQRVAEDQVVTPPVGVPALLPRLERDIADPAEQDELATPWRIPAYEEDLCIRFSELVVSPAC